MPVYRLDNALRFPDPADADESGLLAVGGDLGPERLLLAYSLGIFPWYEEGQPILWHSPNPRMVLRPEELRLSRSLRKTLRSGRFDLVLDRAFPEVIRACAEIPRRGQRGTWITTDMIEAYEHLFERGYAHSAEAYVEGELVGGLYGVSLGSCFFGESMFSRHANASKAAFAALSLQLASWGFTLLDCQLPTPHLARFGAVEWGRERFLATLRTALAVPTRRGRWHFDAPPDARLGGGPSEGSSRSPDASNR